jgi:uncharacterized RDD family membrane protein YckC
MKYASFSRRFLAMLIDVTILIIPCAIVGHVVPVLGGVLVIFLYMPLMEASELKATLGKHILSIEVVDQSGFQISLKTATLRYLMKFFSSLIFCVGYLMALFTARKQTLHDLVADTIVIDGRVERPWLDVWVETVRDLFKNTTRARTPISELERLQALRERGALTEEEFLAQKQKLM